MRPSPNYYATPAQLAYLRRLLNECFADRVEHGTGFDAHHLSERTTRADASAAIETCKRKLDAEQRARVAKLIAGVQS